jgi:hypothetical protein
MSEAVSKPADYFEFYMSLTCNRMSNQVTHRSVYDDHKVWPMLLKHFLNVCEQYGYRIPASFEVGYFRDEDAIDVTFDSDLSDLTVPPTQTISA